MIINGLQIIVRPSLELANITMYIDFRFRFSRMHRLRTTTNSDKFVKTHESV